MARAPVDTRLPVEFLQPQAAPVDTYVNPGPSPLRDFAESLSKLDRPLKQFLDDRAKKQADEDRLRGEAAFYSDNSEDIATAVRNGDVPAQYSPNFVKGFRNAQGYVAGNQLRAKFNAAFDAWDGKNSDDPAAFDTFMEGFIRENVADGQDPEVLRGLLPHVRQLTDEGFNRYEDYRHKQTVEGSLTAHVAAANQDIDELNREGLATEEGTNYPVVFQKIAEKRAAFVASGGDPEAFDKSMTDAMSAKILATRDPGLLAWFDQKVPGKDYSYGDSPYGAKVKLETTESLEVIARRSVAEDAEKQKAADKAAKDAAHRQAIELLSENPSAPMPDGLLSAGQKVDPEFKVHIEEWRKTLGSGFSDPKRIQAVYDAILSGGGQAVIIDAFRNGVFGRPEDLRDAYSFLKGFEGNEDRIKKALTNPTADRFMKDIDIRTKGVNPMTLDPIAGTSNEGYEAQYDFKRLMTDWIMQNPNATSEQLEDATNRIGKSILDRVTRDDTDPTAAGVYDRGQDLEFQNPFTAGTTPAPTSEAAPEVPAEEPPTEGEQQDDKADAEDFLNGLTPDQRSALEGQATRMGLSVEDFVKTYALPKQAPTEKPDQRSDAGPSGETTGSIVQNASYSPPTEGTLAAAKASLVSSSKRGYVPDLDHLRPRIVTGVSRLQAAWGQDLPIVSGFRDTGRNRKAGGAKKSQHIHGNAVDIDVSNLSKPDRVKLIKLASEQGFTGTGVYANSLHLDYGGRRYWGPDHHKGSLPGWAREAMAEHINRTGPVVPRAFTREEAEGFLDDALVAQPEDLSYAGSTKIGGDEVASRLGNMIGQLESGGNYNAVFGKPNNTVDLSQFTLNDILYQQTVARRGGSRSTAIGKYQFLQKTLRGLKKELGLKGSEKFTPELQDHLFHALLLRRGYDLYRSGRMSKRRFALGLSQEWASLPDPRTGRSYYAGDGFHGRTRAKPRDVYAALGMDA